MNRRNPRQRETPRPEQCRVVGELGALDERVEDEEDGDFVAADGGGTAESGGG